LTRVLVTGAAGFIGSNLSEYLIEQGWDVVGFDNMSTGQQRNVDRLKYAGASRFTFIEGDITDPDAVASAIDGCKHVVHLAAQVSVQRSFDDIKYNDSVNVGGFINVATAAIEANVSRFIYASSCAVYGDNPTLPLKESDELRPLSPYAVSKLANELYAKVMAAANPGIAILGLRFFNIYGPWQNPEGAYAAVIPKWISARLAQKRPVMFGDGTASRDFCHVDDVCEVIVAFLGIACPPTGAVFNLGSGVATTLAELDAQIISALDNSGLSYEDAAIEKKPWRSGEIKHSLADTSLVRDAFGTRAETTLADGITSMLSLKQGLFPA